VGWGPPALFFFCWVVPNSNHHAYGLFSLFVGLKTNPCLVFVFLRALCGWGLCFVFLCWGRGQTNRTHKTWVLLGFGVVVLLSQTIISPLPPTPTNQTKHNRTTKKHNPPHQPHANTPPPFFLPTFSPFFLRHTTFTETLLPPRSPYFHNNNNPRHSSRPEQHFTYTRSPCVLVPGTTACPVFFFFIPFANPAQQPRRVPKGTLHWPFFSPLPPSGTSPNQNQKHRPLWTAFIPARTPPPSPSTLQPTIL